jgi:hypothetical protein
MAEATMQGVSLLTKTRRRPVDLFELALTYDGIEIRRPGESARHLSWDRVSEWEIEQRRDGVLLTLRGGGSVTPLVIPSWSVDELDVVLRQVTAPPPEPTPGDTVTTAPEPATQLPTSVAAVVHTPKPAPAVVPKIAPPPPAAPAPTPTPTRITEPAPPTPERVTAVVPTPTPVEASRPEVKPEPEVAPRPEPVAPKAVAMAAEPSLEIPPELVEALELEPEPPLEPIFDDLVAEQLAPRRTEPTRTDEPITASGLVWPQEASNQSVTERPTLSWPAAPEEGADPPTHEFRLPDAPPAAAPILATDLALPSSRVFQAPMAQPLDVAEPPIPAVEPVDHAEDVVAALLATATTTAQVPVVTEPATPTPPPIFIRPREGAPDEVPPPSRADRRRNGGRNKVRPEPTSKVPRERRVRQPSPPRERAVRAPTTARQPRSRAALIRASSTVILLALAALAVGLVLAQSAGMINLPFLGLPG